MSDLAINRRGTTTEYKRGHYYLSHTEWEDGHCEIEIHLCIPQILWHSCDSKEVEKAKEQFLRLSDEMPTQDQIRALIPGTLPPI
jgi:hypothetical protein